MCYVIVLAASHHSHLQATEAIPALPAKVKCAYWCRGSLEACEPSTCSHHSWRERFCEQLLPGSIFSKVSPVFSPRLRQLYHIRVSPNSEGMNIFNRSLDFVVALFILCIYVKSAEAVWFGR